MHNHFYSLHVPSWSILNNNNQEVSHLCEVLGASTPGGGAEQNAAQSEDDLHERNG